MHTNAQPLDLRAFVSRVCILCSATVHVLTNITPNWLWYYRLCLFGDAINQTVCVHQNFKHSETEMEMVLLWNSWLPALLSYLFSSHLYLERIFFLISFLK